MADGCARPDCPGTYLSDDTCDYCGFKRPDQPTAAVARSTTVHSSAPRALGAGLVALPNVPARDPAAAVLTDPRVPERRRTCRQCGRLVGQERDGRPGLVRGFCPYDGTAFSFVPPLAPGDTVGARGRYEIIGCLAYGGVGWIYLARDTNLGDGVAEHWVVLKGLIDTRDADAVAAAVNERRFLVEVDHPNIVKILDFVRERDRATGDPVGYIVMEYIGGRTLRELFLLHRDPDGERSPLPLPTVLAYGIDVLTALAHLHRRGLVFCDLKPENVMHVDDQVKLIDLGAVLPAGSLAVYGTPGYQAPELTAADPAPVSPASDVYSLGRTLAILANPFEGFGGELAHRLPEPRPGDAIAEFESFHRLLLRATHPDPAARFGSAEEAREQVHGVLLEVLAHTDGTPRRVTSTLFGPERGVFGADVRAAAPSALPTPLVDLADPAAGFLATLGVTEPEALVSTLETAPGRTPEVLLRLVDARIALGDPGGARADLAEFDGRAPGNWRVGWFEAMLAIAEGDPATAVARLDVVCGLHPGEIAPRLALAAAAEADGDTDRAAGLYRRVWATDTSYVSAAFGLARVLVARGDAAGAVTALDAVPASSSQHIAALVAAVRARVGPGADRASVLDAAARVRRLDRIAPDPARTAKLSADVITAALNIPPDPAATLFDRPFDEHNLRLGLESAYRALAALTTDRATRSALVDRANEVRPWTLT